MPRGDELIDRERTAIVFQQVLARLEPGEADHLLEDGLRHLVTHLQASRQDGLLVENLSVEEQTVHVENNGGWPAGELHRLLVGDVRS
jgi:hypothetical protein